MNSEVVLPGTTVPKFPNLIRVTIRSVDAIYSDVEPVIFSGGSKLTSIVSGEFQFDEAALENVASAYPNLSRLFISVKGPIRPDLWKSFPNLSQIQINGDTLDAAHLQAIVTHCRNVHIIYAPFNGDISAVLQDPSFEQSSVFSIGFQPGTKGISNSDIMRQNSRLKHIELRDLR